ncbi:Terminase small subunit [Streptomyces phage Dennebes]|jgi:hypothetical protein|nr:Terminase small subunit [Streptomyces phage Dennebes]
MAVIDTDRVVTVAQLVEELHVSIPTARGIVQDLSVVATINRTSFYDREDVKAELRARNDNLLAFLGVLSPEDSYDGNIVASMETSLNEL